MGTIRSSTLFQLARTHYRRVRVALRGRTKVFGIGVNKTGTTSLARALRDLGYLLGNQGQAELLIDDWARGDFRRIVRYCRYAEAFQDAPFPLSGIFQALDAAFPGSKFVLTIRDTPEQWYESLTRFHSQRFGNGKLPNEEDLANASYRYRGFVLHAMRLVYGDKLYDRDAYIQHYNEHNETVMRYFGERTDDLLVLNPAMPGAYSRLCEFLGFPATGKAFPHENRSEPRPAE